MYTRFYNLREKPFEITPDPHFLYLAENHKEALAHLTYAVKERKGFTVITGEVGTGKTTLIQTLLTQLDGNTRTAYVFNPRLDPTDFLQHICQDLGLETVGKSKGQCLSQLHKFLLDCYTRNENVVLIIDEAQVLDPLLLEEVRLLTNLETAKNKLLQVILIGQPELNEILNRPECRQLKQRVILRYHIKPLNKGETKEYIRQRLTKAGAVDSDLFTGKAVEAIYRYSKGIPRSINILCDNALLSGYASDQRLIGDHMIKEVARHLEGVGTQKQRMRLRFCAGIVFVIGYLALFCLIWNLSSLKDIHFDLGHWVYAFKEAIEKFLRIFSVGIGI